MRGSKGADNELAINNDEFYAKRILEKFEKKETSENNFENKNGSLDNIGSHSCENDKILKEKEAELDNFVHQPPRGGNYLTPTEHQPFFVLLYTLYIVIFFRVEYSF